MQVETATYLRKCMRESTTPALRVLEMVLPPGGVRAGPTELQMLHVRGEIHLGPTSPQHNIDC